MFSTKKVFVVLLLVLLAVSERLWFDLGPNVELVTLASVLAGLYLGSLWPVAVPLLALAITDRLLGNSLSFLFVWSAYAFLGAYLTRHPKTNVFILAIAFPVFFFLWTNFGVWLEGLWYPRNFAGLASCFVAALPFFKNHLLSNLVILPLGVGFASLAKVWRQILKVSRRSQLV